MGDTSFNPVKVISPVKTLHGTNADSLVEDYCDAREAVQAALDTACNIEFNARDYADMGTFQAAKAERQANLQKLRDVVIYLEAMAIACGNLKNQ